jgi:hypothetical protein
MRHWLQKCRAARELRRGTDCEKRGPSRPVAGNAIPLKVRDNSGKKRHT